MKNHYFPHDYGARNDEKLCQLRMEFGAEGYGVYWMMVEAMHEQGGEIRNLKAFAFSANIDFGLVERISKATLSVGLFEGKATPEQTLLFSPRIKNQIELRQLYIDKQKQNGKRGGQAKILGYPRATPRQAQGNPLAYNEMKGNKSNTKILRSNTVNIYRSEGGARAPTPAQIAEEFFESQDRREEYIGKLVEKGIPEGTARSEVKKFAAYWTERTKSGSKQKWETQDTFELKYRLAKWINNASKFSPPSA